MTPSLQDRLSEVESELSEAEWRGEEGHEEMHPAPAPGVVRKSPRLCELLRGAGRIQVGAQEADNSVMEVCFHQ